MHEIDLVCDHLLHTKKLLATNQEPPELSICTFKPVLRTTFETRGENFQNLHGMKLKNGVTLLYLSAVMNDIFVYFLLQVWTMKLTESTNNCYISDRVACTIKVNIKETIMGNDGFLQMFMWLMDFS